MANRIKNPDWQFFLTSRCPWEVDIEEVLRGGRIRPVRTEKGKTATERRAWSRRMNARRAALKKERARQASERVAAERAERNGQRLKGRRRNAAGQVVADPVPAHVAPFLLAMRPGVWHSAPELEAATGADFERVRVKHLQRRGWIEKGLNAAFDAEKAKRGLLAGNPRFLWRLTKDGEAARRLAELFS